MRGRVILSEARSGAFNMALDEALFLSAREDLLTLRLYAWTPATLSLGYFQPRSMVPASLAARYPLVRRPTGGGALVHGTEEVTISLTGKRAAGPPRPEAAVGLIIEGLKEALAPLGVAPRLGGVSGGPEDAVSRPAPFLCGALRRPLDVVADGPGGPRKLLGSAQRRRAGAWLIHGGLSLAPARGGGEAAPEAGPWPLPDLLSAGGAATPPDLPSLRERVRASLVRGFSRALGLDLVPSSPETGELLLADRLLAERYSAPRWLGRR